MELTCPSTLPWMVPNPVRGSNFLPNRSGLEEFNLEVDLGAIGAFKAMENSVSENDLLWSDLQTQMAWRVPRGRLGGGRAGTYRGKYLKGIGRTLAAGNWSNHDCYHNSGHLLPSGAIREYVASVYLTALGHSKSIIPCEGVLLRDLPEELHKFYPLVFGERIKRGAAEVAIDRELQAITVKPAGFLRISNLIWHLNHLSVDFHPKVNALQDFLQLLNSYLRSVRGESADEAPPSPKEFAALFVLVVEQAVSHFQAYFRAGIHWGSYYNNFTLDGRFLDLELAIFAGGPSFTLFVEPREFSYPAPQWEPIQGTELLFYAYEILIFTRYFGHTLQFFLSTPSSFPSAQRAYIKALARAWCEKTTAGDFWPASKEGTLGTILGLMRSEMDTTLSQRRFIQKVLSYEYDRLFRGGPKKMPAISFARAGFRRPFHCETTVVLNGLAERSFPLDPKNAETAEYFWQLLDRLHSSHGTSELLAELSRAEKSIQTRFTGARRSSDSKPINDRSVEERSTR